MFPTKILLATDGSEEAIRAARVATTLSEKLDSELHVVYVEPLPDPYAVPESYHRAQLLAREVNDNQRHQWIVAGLREVGVRRTPPPAWSRRELPAQVA